MYLLIFNTGNYTISFLFTQDGEVVDFCMFVEDYWRFRLFNLFLHYHCCPPEA
jgi:hypothetical protein